MSLRDRFPGDRLRVFINAKQFATEHTWNGKKFLCVLEEDEALKRKNNNVNDISWDNNTIDTLFHVCKEDWPGRQKPVPNEFGYFDNVHMKILQITDNEGIYTICLSANSPKQIAE